MLPQSFVPASHASRKEATSLTVLERGNADSRIGDPGKLSDSTSPVHPKMALPPFGHASHNNNNNKEDPEQMSQFLAMVEVSEETALCPAISENGSTCITSSKEVSLSPIPGHKSQREAAGPADLSCGNKNSSGEVCGKLLQSPARIEAGTPSVESCSSSRRLSSHDQSAAPPTDSGNGYNTREVPGRPAQQPPASGEAARRNAVRQLIARLFESSSDEDCEDEEAVLLGTAACPILVDCDSDTENTQSRPQLPASSTLRGNEREDSGRPSSILSLDTSLFFPFLGSVNLLNVIRKDLWRAKSLKCSRRPSFWL